MDSRVYWKQFGNGKFNKLMQWMWEMENNLIWNSKKDETMILSPIVG